MKPALRAYSTLCYIYHQIDTGRTLNVTKAALAIKFVNSNLPFGTTGRGVTAVSDLILH